MSAWRLAAYRAVRPILFRVDPERIHHAALSGLHIAGLSAPGRLLCAFASGISSADASRHPFELMGLRFRNRIGLAAGFDKDGVAIRGWAALGFGFVELGTVTPRPQPGNPRPRLFRLTEDEALINRMGFNNLGADALARRIRIARQHLPDGFVVGVNIGRNRDGDASDYALAAHTVADVADYIAINVSSPNTPGLRDHQDPDRLLEILDGVRAAAPHPPILVKLSPDLEGPQLDELIGALVSSTTSGVILSNTTISRDGLGSVLRSEAGGLSGRPLLGRALDMIARARFLAGPGFTIIASGGIGAPEHDLLDVFNEHADLAQLWTGLMYAGPGLIGETVNASS
ncbi:MAG: quinone-dependent dihydroorotate dehydrogenase [Candidatus Limnocylindria bacterium]